LRRSAAAGEIEESLLAAEGQVAGSSPSNRGMYTCQWMDVMGGWAKQ